MNNRKYRNKKEMHQIIRKAFYDIGGSKTDLELKKEEKLRNKYFREKAFDKNYSKKINNNFYQKLKIMKNLKNLMNELKENEKIQKSYDEINSSDSSWEKSDSDTKIKKSSNKICVKKKFDWKFHLVSPKTSINIQGFNKK